MSDTLLETISIRGENDIVKVRRKVRDICKQIGFRLADVTRVVTAASELARNIFHYAKEGTVYCHSLHEGSKKGIELIFEDNGPGIKDIDLVMQEGFSTGHSMGLGLPGAKRLVDSLKIESQPLKGTKVTITKWMK